MRFVSLTVIVMLVAAAFVAGRVTAPSAALAAMPMATTYSHFECYTEQIKGSFNATVQLTDQFQSYQTAVGAPEFFCTPVTKKVISGPNMRVPVPANHLTCYQIQGPTVNQTRPFSNQFQKSSVVAMTPQLLCVPTNKQG
ncbi:MAG: hypothetical protein JO104_02155 [Candidatus Eremiobacteraeota bacterium]|nr:hypothetical protein [Candidatus Eremiobacteraeota bacterium]